MGTNLGISSRQSAGNAKHQPVTSGHQFVTSGYQFVIPSYKFVTFGRSKNFLPTTRREYKTLARDIWKEQQPLPQDVVEGADALIRTKLS